MLETEIDKIRDSYNRVADEYRRRIHEELENKPFDRELLDQFASRIPAGGLVCDLGCGPGHVACYLHNRGVSVCGIDLSGEQIRHAGLLNPELKFKQGNMLRLEEAAESFAGIVAYYSIVQLPQSEHGQAFSEIWRVLAPDGLLLVSFHVGDEIRHYDEWWGHQVTLDFHFFQPEKVADSLRAAGFEIEQIFER